MKQQFESGRSIPELLAVLAIIGILSVSSLLGVQRLMNKNKVNSIIQAVNLASVQILTTLTHRKMATPEEMNAFLTDYSTTAGGYNITFKAPTDIQEFTGTEFVAEITDKDGSRIKGSMCRQIVTSMIQVQGVSDIDFTVNNEETEDGSVENVTMRLSGKAVDLNALCGKDVF